MWTQDEALRIAQDHPTISLVLLVLALVGLEWIISHRDRSAASRSSRRASADAS